MRQLDYELKKIQVFDSKKINFKFLLRKDQHNFFNKKTFKPHTINKGSNVASSILFTDLRRTIS